MQRQYGGVGNDFHVKRSLVTCLERSKHILAQDDMGSTGSGNTNNKRHQPLMPIQIGEAVMMYHDL
jgi:hypothetical protein